MNPPWLLAISAYYWHFPVMIVVISLVYSATRFESWPDILRETLRWIYRMVVFLGGIALAMFLFSLFV